MQTAMNIGTVIDKESLDPLTDAIVRIMEARADQRTIRAALNAFGRMAKVEGVTIANCVINGDRTLNVDMDSGKIDDSAGVRFDG